MEAIRFDGQIVEFYPYRKALAPSSIEIKMTDEIYKCLVEEIEECSKECLKQYREFYRNTYCKSLSKEQFEEKCPNVKPHMDNHICFVVQDYYGNRTNFMYSDNVLHIGGNLTIKSW